MTQEDKELLLKDLFARLPYKFIVHRYSDNVDISIDDIDDFAHFLEYSEGEDFKPYLRPMSDMTEKEKAEIDDYLNKSIEGKLIGFGGRVVWLTDYYLSHHIDYRGLIPLNLAIAVTKENNPYSYTQ